MLSFTEKIQASIADKLRRTEALRSLEVVVDRADTLEGKLDEKLAAKVGLSVLVKIPTPTGAALAGSAVTFSPLICRVRIIENLLTNASGLSAPLAAQLALKALCAFTPEGAASALTPRVTYPWNHNSGTLTTNAVELVLETSATVNL